MNKSYLIIDKFSRVKLEASRPYAVNRLIEEIEKLGGNADFAYFSDIQFRLFDGQFQVFVKDNPIENYTHIIMRGHSNRQEYELKQIINNLVSKSKNQISNIKVLNSEFMNVLPHYSKMYQAIICAQNEIPFLNTIYNANGDYNSIKNHPNFDRFILKEFTGANDLRILDGIEKVKKNIYLIEKDADLNQENLTNKNMQDYFAQEFISTGEDYRIYMQKDKFIGGWKRKATSSFITVDKGEYSNYNEPSQAIVKICEKTAKTFKSNFMAIDLILKNDQPYILEVNMNPGFKAYEAKVPGVIGVDKANIARAIVESF